MILFAFKRYASIYMYVSMFWNDLQKGVGTPKNSEYWGRMYFFFSFYIFLSGLTFFKLVYNFKI